MKNVDTKNVIVQAGGNCGLYTKIYAKQFKTVYTFEPVPDLFKCLVLNTPENVVKIQGCIGNEHKLVNMNEHEGGNIGGGYVNGNGILPMFKIDDLNLPECNLIHLDIEGYEKNALIGASDTITRCKPVICIEDCEKWLKRYSTSLEDIEEFLTSFGYSYYSSARGDRIYKCNQL
jgi:FkbM family methyltransferase